MVPELVEQVNIKNTPEEPDILCMISFVEVFSVFVVNASDKQQLPGRPRFEESFDDCLRIVVALNP